MSLSRTLYHELLITYKEIPDRVAVRLLFNNKSEQVITYRKLILGASGYAHKLLDAGIKTGEVVILILPHSADLIYAFFGAILQGAIPSIMPFLTEKLDPSEYRRSLQALFEITLPAAIITYPKFLAEIGDTERKAPTIRTVIDSNSIHFKQDISFDLFLGKCRSADQTVLLQHSSGTTGLQKGIALSHQAVFNQLDSYAKAIHLSTNDVIVSWLPLYHDMGLIAGFILPILRRVPLVLLSPFDWVRAPQRLMHAIGEYHGTLCWLPNFAYNFSAQKIRSRDLEGLDLSSLRALINCSEPMYLESHQIFQERFKPYGFNQSALATSYAMAENVFAVTQGGIEESITIDTIDRTCLVKDRIAKPVKESNSSLEMISAGKPIENTHIQIIDESGLELPERHIGEIAIKSNCMLSEYYHRTDLTQKAFHDGWYLTGDYGYQVSGELFVTGRKKDLIIVGGKNIYPQDLERIAGQVSGVHPGRTVAFGLYNPIVGTEEVVVIAEVGDQQIDHRHQIADEIRLKVSRGSDITLRYVHLVNRGWLIKTSSGKIARNANRQKYMEEGKHV